MSKFSDQRRETAIRNRFNPIRGLSPVKLSQQLDSFRMGYLRECALLWEAMQRRDVLLRNVVSKRNKAVARAQWEILTVNDSPEAMDQKRVLERFYNNVMVTSVLDENERGGFGLLLRLMMSAQGMRYAAFEKVWKWQEGQGIERRQNGRSARSPSAAPKKPASGTRTEKMSVDGTQTGNSFLTAEFRFVPLEFFENRTGRLRFLESDYDIYGVEMKESDWLVCVGDGIMEATSVAYMYKHMALKDWVACSEAFGTPLPWIKTDAALNSPEWRQLETAASQLMAQKAIVTSNNDSLELVEMKGATNLPFPPLVELMDRAIASLWRGADLSTISQGQAGVGASLQGDESDLLLEDDAKWLAEILWDQCDAQVLEYALGVTEPLAYVSILPPKRKNVEQDLSIDRQLALWRVPQSIDDVLERYGRPLATPGDPLIAQADPNADGALGQPAAAASRPTLANEDLGKKRLLKAKRDLMGPVLLELRRIEGLQGEEQVNAMRALQGQLPALRESLENQAGAGEVADVLAEEMAAALLQGFKNHRGTESTEKKGTK